MAGLAGGGLPVGYDASGRGALDVADVLAGMRPRVRLHGLDGPEYIVACSALYRRLVDGELHHHAQPDLTAAVEVAVRRRVGDSGWTWGRRASEGDITALSAATVALRTLTTMRARTRPVMRSA